MAISPFPVNIQPILSALGQSAQINERKRLERERRRAARLGTIGALGGAAAGFAIGGPPGALFGLQAGRQVGGAVAGQPIDAVALASTGLGALQFQQNQAALAQRNEATQAVQSALSPPPVVDETGRETPGQVDLSRLPGALAGIAPVPAAQLAAQLARPQPGRTRQLSPAEAAAGGFQTGSVVQEGPRGKRTVVQGPPSGGKAAVLFDITDAKGNLILDEAGFPLGNAITREEAKNRAAGTLGARIRKFSETRRSASPTTGTVTLRSPGGEKEVTLTPLNPNFAEELIRLTSPPNNFTRVTRQITETEGLRERQRAATGETPTPAPTPAPVPTAEGALAQAAREGTGPYSSIKAAIDSVLGGLLPEGTIIWEKNQRSRQNLRLFNQQYIRVAIKNKRFPIKEVKEIKKLLGDPDTFFTNPETEALKYATARRVMEALRLSNDDAIRSGLLSQSDQNEVVRNNAEIDALFALMDEPTARPPPPPGEGAIGLKDVDLMTEEELDAEIRRQEQRLR